jgi:hypothetical protein
MMRMINILNILIIKGGEDKMHEKHEGEMGMEHGMGMKKSWFIKKMMWDQLDDDAKKQYMLRKLDEKIMKKEYKIKLIQHKVETLRMLKTQIER